MHAHARHPADAAGHADFTGQRHTLGSPGPPQTENDTVPLRSLDLFAGLPDSELEELADRCDLSTAHPGQVIQAQDVPVRMWHVITSGHAIVQRDDRPVGLLDDGVSTRDDVPHPDRARALTDSLPRMRGGEVAAIRQLFELGIGQAGEEVQETQRNWIVSVCGAQGLRGCASGR